MISVIIPTYKEPDYLDLCLQSAIKNQKEQNEIIVVYDRFLMQFYKFCEEYNAFISFVKLKILLYSARRKRIF